MIRLDRAYNIKGKDIGYSILVDRLWPRGIKKVDLLADKWMKDVAPSPALRKWYDHDPKKWDEFKKEYRSELSHKIDLLKEILQLEKEHKTVTLLYGAKDTEHTHALVIEDALKDLKRKT